MCIRDSYEISAAHARPLTGETATDAAGMPEIAVPPVPGYYTLTTRIGAALLAVAPASAPTPSQLLGQPRPRAWGLAAQVYSCLLYTSRPTSGPRTRRSTSAMATNATCRSTSR